jgi:hypothetical protein
MVSRTRLKSLLTGLVLYTMAAMMVGYFGVNAYTGKYGLNARQELRLRQSARSGPAGQSELIKLASAAAPFRRNDSAVIPA